MTPTERVEDALEYTHCSCDICGGTKYVPASFARELAAELESLQSRMAGYDEGRRLREQDGVMVPREPTKEMLMCFGHEWITGQAYDCYRAMLSAAPHASGQATALTEPSQEDSGPAPLAPLAELTNQAQELGLYAAPAPGADVQVPYVDVRLVFQICNQRYMTPNEADKCVEVIREYVRLVNERRKG